MIAVFVNCGAVIVGSILGILLSSRFNKKMEEAIQIAAGIVTFVLGIQMAFKFDNVIYLTLSVILGGILGTIIDIDGKILSLGNLLERLVYRKKSSENKNALQSENQVQVQPEIKGKSGNFAYAFLNATILYCVGAMTILGSLKAGIEKDYSIIFTKSILDGFMAISFSAAMGIGTAFSAFSIFVIQGAITMLSTLVQPFCTDQMIGELTGVGGCLIIMIGINLVGLKKIKTANYTPSLLFIVIFVLLDPFFKNIHF